MYCRLTTKTTGHLSRSSACDLIFIFPCSCYSLLLTSQDHLGANIFIFLILAWKYENNSPYAQKSSVNIPTLESNA